MCLLSEGILSSLDDAGTAFVATGQVREVGFSRAKALRKADRFPNHLHLQLPYLEHADFRYMPHECFLQQEASVLQQHVSEVPDVMLQDAAQSRTCRHPCNASSQLSCHRGAKVQERPSVL